MQKILYKLSLLFSAGALGGLANSIAVWGFGILGINAMLNVSIQPTLSPEWLYPRLVWGGIWGGIFILLESRQNKPSFFVSASIASIAPALVMLLVVFPLKAGKGYWGLDLGELTPLLVFFFNFVWAVTTLALFRYTHKK